MFIVLCATLHKTEAASEDRIITNYIVKGLTITGNGESYDILFMLAVEETVDLRPRFTRIVQVNPTAYLIYRSSLGSPYIDVSNCVSNGSCTISEDGSMLIGSFTYDISAYVSNPIIGNTCATENYTLLPSANVSPL